MYTYAQIRFKVSQRAPSHPAPPRPAVNVVVGAPSVAPSAHGEVDVVADGTHAAACVAAAEWLAATLGGGDVTAGGAGAHNGAVFDGLYPGSGGRDTSASPSNYLLTVHDNHDGITPLLSHQYAAPRGSGDGEDCDGVDRGVTHVRLYSDAQGDSDDDESVDVLEAILGHVGHMRTWAATMWGWIPV